jgi:SAM-dependent methyltransferase
MIIMTDGGIQGTFPRDFAYCPLPLLSRLVLRCTRFLRARNAERYVPAAAERHLDVGCGDGYFLKRSRARVRYGMDRLLGDLPEDLGALPDETFDCVTMLAVIEHLDRPDEFLDQVFRLMKPGARLVLTTPRRAAHRFIRVYDPGVDGEHKDYYDRASLAALLDPGFELTAHHTFLLGLNQAFCFTRRHAPAGVRPFAARMAAATAV